MPTNVNEKIKERRQDLGLKEGDVAKQAGLSWNEYYDIEAYTDEIFTVTNLSQVKKLCAATGFDFSELFEMRCAFCEEGKQYLEDYSFPRNELIRKRREEMRISQEELGDRIGFEGVAINDMEKDAEYLETWPIDYIKDLSKETNIPMQILLNVKCKKCGR